MARKNKQYTYKNDKHPYKDIYRALSGSTDRWVSRNETAVLFKDLHGFHISRQNLDRAFQGLRKYGLVKHRIRSIKPLKGFTAEDVLKKISHGARNVNTGVLVYEYKITDTDPEQHFKRLVEYSRNNRHGEKPKRSEWRKSRLFWPEEAMYIKMNPDKLSRYMMAKMFNVDENTINGIWSGKTYKDLDLEKYMPIREEIFSQIKTERYDFFTENKI